jgi:hypothetical protein
MKNPCKTNVMKSYKHTTNLRTCPHDQHRLNNKSYEENPTKMMKWKDRYRYFFPLASRHQKGKRIERRHHRSVIAILAIVVPALILAAPIIIIGVQRAQSSHPHGSQVGGGERGKGVVIKRRNLLQELVELLKLELMLEANDGC